MSDLSERRFIGSQLNGKSHLESFKSQGGNRSALDSACVWRNGRCRVCRLLIGQQPLWISLYYDCIKALLLGFNRKYGRDRMNRR